MTETFPFTAQSIKNLLRNPPKGYYRTDLLGDAEANLEALVVALRLSTRHPHAWKWAALAADMLVTTALAIFCNDSTGTGALDNDSQKGGKQCQHDMLGWLQSDNKTRAEPPTPKLASLQALLKRAVVSSYGRCPEKISIECEDIKQILWLHKEIRNDLVHPKPKGWSIRLASLLNCFVSDLAVTSQCMNLERVFESDAQFDRFQAMLGSARRLVASQQAKLPSD